MNQQQLLAAAATVNQIDPAHNYYIEEGNYLPTWLSNLIEKRYLGDDGRLE